jgi:hypothetical protein
MVAINRADPVFAVRRLEVAPADFDRLYGEIASFMSGPGGDLPGIMERQLLGNLDRTRLTTIVHFRSYVDWVNAQWDARLAELLEELTLNCRTLEFDLYRGDRFPVKALA